MLRTRPIVGLSALSLLFATMVFAPVQAAVLEVAPDGSGDYATIQTAMSAAASGDTIDLAPGTYTGGGNHDLVNVGKDLLIRRTPGFSVTDYAELDLDGSEIEPRRAFAVASGTVTLQHLKLQYGWAEDGGAISVTGGTLELNHCRIYYCVAADRGGAIFADGTATVDINDVWIQYSGAWNGAGLYASANVAIDATNLRCMSGAAENYGGGAYLAGTDQTFNDCNFNSNVSGSHGGGLYLTSTCEAQFIDSGAIANDASDSGGGIYCDSGAAPTFQDCYVNFNTAGAPGGGLATIESDPVFVGGVFESNKAPRGAAVWATEDHSPSFTGVQFDINEAEIEGGVLLVDTDNMAGFTDCVFFRNDLPDGGDGSILLADGASPTLTGCTIALNGSNEAALIYCRNGAAPTLDRCLIAWNTGRVHEDAYAPNTTLTNCNLYSNRGGNWSGSIAGQYGTNGNFSADPRMCDPCDYYGTGMAIMADSPCAPAHSPSGDLIGAGPIDTEWDHPIYGVTNKPQDQVFAHFPDVVTALAEAPSDADIALSAGSNPVGDVSADADGFNGTLRSRSGDPSNAWISCDGVRFLHMTAGTASSAVIRDLRFYYSRDIDEGGFILLESDGSYPSFENCIFENAWTTDRGGAICHLGSGILQLSDCTFDYNLAPYGGGIYTGPGAGLSLNTCTFIDHGHNAYDDAIDGAALYADQANITLVDCAFIDNVSLGHGAAVYVDTPLQARFTTTTFTNNSSRYNGAVEISTASGSTPGSVSFTDCVFTGNQADPAYAGGSGAIDLTRSPATIGGCTFSGNSATYGGALFIFGEAARLDHCTFLDNSAVSAGAVFLSRTSSANQLTNCTFAGNIATGPTPSLCGQIFDQCNDGAVISNCLISHGIDAHAFIWAPATTTTSPYVEKTDIFANDYGDWDGALAGMDLSNDNFCADPIYCGLDEGQVSLETSSPCAQENSPFGQQVGAWGITCIFYPTPAPDAPPLITALGQNHPNPFNPSTEIAFDLAQPGRVTLTVFDAGGHHVDTLVNEDLPTGRHSVTWHGRDASGRRVPSGVYVYRLETAAGISARKMLMLK